MDVKIQITPHELEAMAKAIIKLQKMDLSKEAKEQVEIIATNLQYNCFADMLSAFPFV